MENLKFKKNNYDYLKNNHYRIIAYLLMWIFSRKPPKSKTIDGENYYWLSLQKIADDCFMSYVQVQRSLYRLENKDKSINYGNNEPFIYAKMIYSRSETNKLYIKLNYKKIIEILDDNPVNEKLMSKINNREADMPALFEMESEIKVNENAKRIVDKVLILNPDIFKTRIGNTKTYTNCCKIVQDIYNGLFLNPRVYNFSKIQNCKWFNVNGWKEKINQVKGDYDKVENLIIESIKNFRLMFDKNYMPFKKDCFPSSFEKWLYDAMNENFASYFIFSFKKPNTNGKQLSENKAEKIYNELPEKIQMIGDKICENNAISNKTVFWANLKGLYGWCKWLLDSDINQNVDYWVSSPSEIITKFVDYCDANNVLMNEYTFNVGNSLNRNAPFAWFVSNAINEHKLNKEILKSCA